jgi:hypothetical protein
MRAWAPARIRLHPRRCKLHQHAIAQKFDDAAMSRAPVGHRGHNVRHREIVPSASRWMRATESTMSMNITADRRRETLGRGWPADHDDMARRAGDGAVNRIQDGGPHDIQIYSEHAAI